MKKLLLFASLLLATVVVSADQAISADRLTRIDRVFQQYVDEARIGGAVALVLQDGKPMYERAFGWSDKEAGRKMTTDTIFRIASQTKALTSVAILSLMEEGKIGLNDPAGRYIPTFAKTTVAVANDQGAPSVVPAKRAITIRDLLTHTAGISYGTSAPVASQYEAKGLGPAAGFGWYTADKEEPICDTMTRLGTLPFVAQPGEAWVYGYNTDILGCIAERVSGQPLDELIRTRITGPLGMKDTQFFLAPMQRDRLPGGHAPRPDSQGGGGPPAAAGRARTATAGRSAVRPTARAARAITSTVRAAALPAAPACCPPPATMRGSSR